MIVLVSKLAAVESAVAAVIVAATQGLDGAAERIVLWSAAGAGLLWFWMHLLRPTAKLLWRAVRAVEQLEQLPGLVERVEAVEKQAAANESALRALMRELGFR